MTAATHCNFFFDVTQKLHVQLLNWGNAINQIECSTKLFPRKNAFLLHIAETVFLKRQLCSPHFVVSCLPGIGNALSRVLIFYDHQLIVRSLLDPWVSSSGTRGYRQMMGAESYYLSQAHFLIRDYLQPMSKVRLDLQSGNDC